MKIIEKDLQLNLPEFPSDALFLDIETTGLSVDRSHVYLFGCIHRRTDGVWHFMQWLIEGSGEEADALREINDYADGFNVFVHFNGDRFDLPYLDTRALRAGIDSRFLKHESMDLFKCLRRCKDMFGLANSRQKSFEKFAGIDREDLYDGGQLIEVYHDYCSSHDPELLRLLLLHNEEDVINMTSLIALLPYADLKEGHIPSLSSPCLISRSEDEVLLRLTADAYYPVRVSMRCGGIYMIAEADSINIRIPLYTGEMKHFLAPAKDYYYLPLEDTAMHKSVAAFVDPACRQKATKETCYVRRAGTFYELPEPLIKDIFSSTYNGTPYGLYTDDILTDTELLRRYISAAVKHAV